MNPGEYTVNIKTFLAILRGFRPESGTEVGAMALFILAFGVTLPITLIFGEKSLLGIAFIFAASVLSFFSGYHLGRIRTWTAASVAPNFLKSHYFVVVSLALLVIATMALAFSNSTLGFGILCLIFAIGLLITLEVPPTVREILPMVFAISLGGILQFTTELSLLLAYPAAAPLMLGIAGLLLVFGYKRFTRLVWKVPNYRIFEETLDLASMLTLGSRCYITFMLLCMSVIGMLDVITGIPEHYICFLVALILVVPIALVPYLAFGVSHNLLSRYWLYGIGRSRFSFGLYIVARVGYLSLCLTLISLIGLMVMMLISDTFKMPILLAFLLLSPLTSMMLLLVVVLAKDLNEEGKLAGSVSIVFLLGQYLVAESLVGGYVIGLGIYIVVALCCAVASMRTIASMPLTPPVSVQ